MTVTRTPSLNNPFILPAELQDFPLLYRALIRPIREADFKEGKQFLKRFYDGIQDNHNTIVDLIASVWDVHDPVNCPADLLQYLQHIVGFTDGYNYITERLSTQDLRKLIRLAVPLWKERFSELGIINLIRLLTGRTVVLLNWFYWRTILGETILDEEQLGYDFWLIGGAVTFHDEFLSQVRIMDDGTLDEQLVLDLLSLERVLSERIEVVLVDFLDWFDLDRDKWLTLTGTSAEIVDQEFVIPAGTDEQAIIPVSTGSYSEYATVHKFKLDTGATLLTRFYVDDWSGGDYYEVEVELDSVRLLRYLSGSPTVISAPTLGFPLYEDLWYKLRIVAVDESGNHIKVFIDGNSVIDTTDASAPTQGDVVIGSKSAGANVTIDNVEVWQVPLRMAEIAPDGITTTPNW